MNAYEVIDLSGIADSGQDYECTSVNDRLSGGSAACLFCQSGVWRKNQIIDKPILRYGDWGNIPSPGGVPDSSIAYCETDEIVIGGGGSCTSPGYAWVHDSKPISKGTILNQTTVALNDGWYTNCFGRGPYAWTDEQDYPSNSYAICLKR